jgi:hypothetical protein
MRSTFARIAPVLVLATFVALSSASVSAQSFPLLTASDFSYHLQSWDPIQRVWATMNPTQQSYYFNRARCECAGDQTSYGGSFRIAIEMAPTTGDKIRNLLNQNGLGTGIARLYAGGNEVSCLTPANVIGGTLATYCVNLVDPADLNAGIPGGMATLAATRVWFSDPIPVAWVFNAASYPVCSGSACNDLGKCAAPAAKVNVYFWAQTSSSPAPDMSNSLFSVNLAGAVPLAPVGVTVQGGNEALAVGWGWPTGTNAVGGGEVFGVQLFCQRAPDQQVFRLGDFGAAFVTSQTLCPDVAPAPSVPLPFDNLYPGFLCSGLIPVTTNSYRIKGLQNGLPYTVGVAAVDRFGNVSLTNTADGTPSAPDGGISVQTRFPGGCGCVLGGRDAANAFGLPLLVLAAWLLSRRRRR